MGHWRSSSYNRKPPLDNWHSTVPSWEKKFCASVGSVPWGKLLESKKYMYLHDNVVNWDDSAVKEAFDNAKTRFWAEINGLPCNISLPDPDIYIDDVDWNSSADPELLLDLEREAIVPSGEEVVILGSSVLMDQSFSCTGWGDAEAVTPKPYDPNQSFSPTGWGDLEPEIPRPSDPVSAAQVWEPNLRENVGVDSWGQYHTPDEHAKEDDWQNRQNDSRGWNQRGGYGGNRNWGTWDGYNRKRENMSWSKTPAYQGNEYQMNRGRRNNRGRRRGNFAYQQGPYVEKVPTSSGW